VIVDSFQVSLDSVLGKLLIVYIIGFILFSATGFEYGGIGREVSHRADKDAL
jgi:hypothetical protein